MTTKLLFLLSLLLLIPTFTLAQDRVQILDSNLYCEVDSIGSYIVIEARDGTFSPLSFEVASQLVKTEVSKISKKIQRAKLAIRSGVNVTKNKKKLAVLNRLKRYWTSVTSEIINCARIIGTPPPPAPPAPLPVPPFGVVGTGQYYLLLGGSIIAHDGTFLGVFSANQFSSDAIGNRFGSYGSDFGPHSIFNDFGTYGSAFSPQSPWNVFSQTPPRIFVNGVPQAYLSANQFKTPRVAPLDLLLWLGRTAR